MQSVDKAVLDVQYSHIAARVWSYIIVGLHILFYCVSIAVH